MAEFRPKIAIISISKPFPFGKTSGKDQFCAIYGTGPVRSMVINNLWLFCKTSVRALFTRPASSLRFLLNWSRNGRQAEGKESYAKNHGYVVAN